MFVPGCVMATTQVVWNNSPSKGSDLNTLTLIGNGNHFNRDTHSSNYLHLHSIPLMTQLI